jgi:hypothetical protein
MTKRYGHLFAAQEKRLTDAVEWAYRNARWPVDGLGALGDQPGENVHTGTDGLSIP